MLQHYLKIAIRNLLKYKAQTLISIVGLAVGFVCFAFATMWIRYEMAYDKHYEGADRLYLFYKNSTVNYNGYDTDARNLLPILRENFPEVEIACGIELWKKGDVDIDGEKMVRVRSLIADSTFMEMFGVRILKGTPDFLWSTDDENEQSNKSVAITDEAARRLYGSTDVIGKEVKHLGTVCAIVTRLPQSSLSFDFWRGGEYNEASANPLLFRLRKDADLSSFLQKLENYTQTLDGKKTTPFKNYRIMKLREYHYSDVNEEKSIKFTYLILFSAIGLMVVFGALFNYLSLFVIRMRMRERETNLRQVCGSSRVRLFLLFATEYILVVLLAGLLGCSLAEGALRTFRTLSGIEGNIYWQLLLFFAGILLLSLLLLLPFVMQQRRRSAMRHHSFRRFSILFQIGTGIFFIFAAMVIMKQLYFLTNTDLGWERKNIASLQIKSIKRQGDNFEHLHAVTRHLNEMPCVNEVMDNHIGLLTGRSWGAHFINDWEGKPLDENKLPIEIYFEGEAFSRFYQLQLKEGRMMEDTEPWKVVLNEAAIRKMNLSNPIGQHITLDGNSTEIVGILKDFHVTAPTVPVLPMAFIGENGKDMKRFGIGMHNQMFLIKFKDGQWDELKSRIEQMAQELEIRKYDLKKTEDVYADYLKSETLLLKLLGIAATVCVIIAAFGIFSLVTLSCEQRRKEIAVRKVNGATVKSILLMFVKEYFSMLAIASVIAFPIGYLFMKRWIESYIEQTIISSWIYLTIFVGIAIVIALCIGWRVWQAARQNPAEVIKSE